MFARIEESRHGEASKDGGYDQHPGGKPSRHLEDKGDPYRKYSYLRIFDREVAKSPAEYRGGRVFCKGGDDEGRKDGDHGGPYYRSQRRKDKICNYRAHIAIVEATSACRVPGWLAVESSAIAATGTRIFPMLPERKLRYVPDIPRAA